MGRTITIDHYKFPVRDWLHHHQVVLGFLTGLVFAVVIVAALEVAGAAAGKLLEERAVISAQRAAAVPNIELPAEWRWQHRPVHVGPIVRSGAVGSAGSLDFVMDRKRRVD